MEIFTVSVEKLWITMVRKAEIGQKSWGFHKLHKISSIIATSLISMTYKYTENKRLANGKT
jgi:hypothetical protein